MNVLSAPQPWMRRETGQTHTIVERVQECWLAQQTSEQRQCESGKVFKKCFHCTNTHKGDTQLTAWLEVPYLGLFSASIPDNKNLLGYVMLDGCTACKTHYMHTQIHCHQNIPEKKQQQKTHNTMNHVTLIYESFKHKKGTELNGWTSVVITDNTPNNQF